MPKAGEIAYVGLIGEAGAAHARGKPFTDPGCGQMLMDLGGMMMVLPHPPARLLDLGCGAGWTSVFFARRGYDVVGQDIAPDMIALAEQNRVESGLPNLRFVVGDYEQLAQEGLFDCAVFYDALHHAEDPAAAIASVAKLLRPGGVLITMEPGVGHAASELSKNAMATYGVTERDMPPRDVVRMGKAAGFSKARIYPMPKTFGIVQYELPQFERLPTFASDFIRWMGLGYLMLLTKRSRGGLVVLTR